MILKSVTYRLRPDSVIIAFYRVAFVTNKYSWKILFSSSAVEVPSYFIGWYIMDKWGRRWILFGTMMIGGLSCISCMFVPVGESPSCLNKHFSISSLGRGWPLVDCWPGHGGEVQHRALLRSHLRVRWGADADSREISGEDTFLIEYTIHTWMDFPIMIYIIQAMGVSSFVAGIGLLIFPYINSLVRPL